MLADSLKKLNKLENLCIDFADSHPYGEDLSNFMSVVAQLKHLRVLAVNLNCD